MYWLVDGEGVLGKGGERWINVVIIVNGMDGIGIDVRDGSMKWIEIVDVMNGKAEKIKRVKINNIFTLK